MMRRLSYLVLVVLCFASAPVSAELLFEERDDALYVKNVERDLPPAQAVAPFATAPDGVLRRSGAPYRELIRQAAKRHAVAPELVESVIRVESNFEPRAVSRKGARGLMQLMPATARLLGVKNVFDVRQNIEGGVRHLRNLTDLYRGNITLALAAYNAGDEAVTRYGGVPPYAETQAYVARVLALLRAAIAPASANAEEGVARTRPFNRYERADGVMVYSNLPDDGLSRAVPPQRVRE